MVSSKFIDLSRIYLEKSGPCFQSSQKNPSFILASKDLRVPALWFYSQTQLKFVSCFRPHEGRNAEYKYRKVPIKVEEKFNRRLMDRICENASENSIGATRRLRLQIYQEQL